MKRQIIKTRPERPYRIARIVIVIVLLALVVIGAYVLAHDLTRHAAAGLQIILVNPPSPATE